MIYVSLLRGINVGGHHKIRMADLKAQYESLGLTDVTTYIQSGNVIFTAPGESEASLRTRLAEMIAVTYGFSVPVTLRTAEEMAQVIAANPFGAIDPVAEGKLYHVTFLQEAPNTAGVAALSALAKDSEKVMAVGREIYLHCPDGYAGTKLSGANLDKHLGPGATTRNWKTVHKITELTRY